MLAGKYGVEELRQAIKKPSSIGGEIRRVRRELTRHRRRTALRLRYGGGIDVMNRDWDYLIILDACRYDVFKECADLDGELDYVISKGSHSEEFCNANFEGNRFYDTVYVTANGYGARIGQNVFHDLIFTASDYSDYECFDDIQPKLDALQPSTVYDAALQAREKYPDKRIIVHFMQPHEPYLGDKARKLRDRLGKEGIITKLQSPELYRNQDSENEKTTRTLAQAAENGYVTRSDFRDAYTENLELALKYVRDLVAEWDGKLVVTADHGELHGKDGIFGHPRNRFDEALRKVPWMVFRSDTRPNITEEEPTASTDIDHDTLQQQLKMLGYRD